MPAHIIGHSAGGLSLTPMAALQPGGAARIIAANPGSLMSPEAMLFIHPKTAQEKPAPLSSATLEHGNKKSPGCRMRQPGLSAENETQYVPALGSSSTGIQALAGRCILCG